ncbi:MAG: hypothetical protein ACLUT3_09460 [Bifidobacterium bifidum]
MYARRHQAQVCGLHCDDQERRQPGKEPVRKEEYNAVPSEWLEIGDSFFIREIPVEEEPFRKYVGICAPGQSLKTTLLRTYAIILQGVYNLSQQDEWKDVIDPYYSLIGYFNSIRELGGAVRLLQDDIPKRMYVIKKEYDNPKLRYLNAGNNVEITSRIHSWQIPEELSQLEGTIHIPRLSGYSCRHKHERSAWM